MGALKSSDLSKREIPVIIHDKINGKNGGGKANFAMGGGNKEEGIIDAINILKEKIKNVQ